MNIIKFYLNLFKEDSKESFYTLSVQYGNYLGEVMTTEGWKQGVDEINLKYVNIPKNANIKVLKSQLQKFIDSLPDEK